MRMEIFILHIEMKVIEELEGHFDLIQEIQ